MKLCLAGLYGIEVDDAVSIAEQVTSEVLGRADMLPRSRLQLVSAANRTGLCQRLPKPAGKTFDATGDRMKIFGPRWLHPRRRNPNCRQPCRKAAKI
jgi:hypothetical protein